MQTNVIKLDHLPACERFDFWWEAVGQSVVSVDAASDHAADFWAEMTAVDLGLVQVSRVRSASFEARRTVRRIRQSDPEFYQLNYTVMGRSGLEQNGRQCTLAPGDFTLYDTSRPFHAWSIAAPVAAEGVIVQFPTRRCRCPRARSNRCCRRGSPASAASSRTCSCTSPIRAPDPP